MLIGFDPGRDKCGIAVITKDKQILYRKVIESANALIEIKVLMGKYHPEALIMGNQTTSKQWQEELRDNINLSVFLVDERNSTVEARERYWHYNPPQGLQRLVPKPLRVPPAPVDDIVAIILVERHLQNS
ncbi:MAG: pre-16S rRNA-processing nuclease YqgF [Cyanobacterium sp. T60_A2020_053]|nr:pre-16S rRNA-processing nuclease YqgF [Cyanobacterium sp. T60_A2020_053]